MTNKSESKKIVQPLEEGIIQYTVKPVYDQQPRRGLFTLFLPWNRGFLEDAPQKPLFTKFYIILRKLARRNFKIKKTSAITYAVFITNLEKNFYLQPFGLGLNPIKTTQIRSEILRCIKNVLTQRRKSPQLPAFSSVFTNTQKKAKIRKHRLMTPLRYWFFQTQRFGGITDSKWEDKKESFTEFYKHTLSNKEKYRWSEVYDPDPTNLQDNFRWSLLAMQPELTHKAKLWLDWHAMEFCQKLTTSLSRAGKKKKAFKTVLRALETFKLKSNLEHKWPVFMWVFVRRLHPVMIHLRRLARGRKHCWVGQPLLPDKRCVHAARLVRAATLKRTGNSLHQKLFKELFSLFIGKDSISYKIGWQRKNLVITQSNETSSFSKKRHDE